MQGWPRRGVRVLVLVLLAQLCAASVAAAQTLTIANSPATPLSVSTATAGAQPDPSEEDATTGYSAVIPASTTKRIVARLNSALPAGVTLRVMLEATSGSQSPGYVDLDIVDKSVLTNLAGGGTGQTFSGSITYTLVATAATTPFTGNIDVVFSLVDP